MKHEDFHEFLGILGFPYVCSSWGRFLSLMAIGIVAVLLCGFAGWLDAH